MNKTELLEQLDHILNDEAEYTYIYSRYCTKIITRERGDIKKSV